MTEHLRMGGIYWCLTALDLLGKFDTMNKQEMIDFVKSCQHPCGGFGASFDHDPHLLHTLSAIQVCIFNYFIIYIQICSSMPYFPQFLLFNRTSMTEKEIHI